jgi:Domain of unknown function (DUF4386)
MTSIRNPGRFAGLLYVLTSIVGFFDMGYVPGKLMVYGDTSATVNNVAAHEMLFRFGIAGQLISQAAFIFVALALYKLLAEVDRRQASLMVILIVVSFPIAFVNELNSLAALALSLWRQVHPAAQGGRALCNNVFGSQNGSFSSGAGHPQGRDRLLRGYRQHRFG